MASPLRRFPSNIFSPHQFLGGNGIVACCMSVPTPFRAKPTMVYFLHPIFEAPSTQCSRLCLVPFVVPPPPPPPPPRIVPPLANVHVSVCRRCFRSLVTVALVHVCLLFVVSAGIPVDAGRVASAGGGVGAAFQNRRALRAHARSGSRERIRRRPRMGVLPRELGGVGGITRGRVAAWA